MCCIIVVILKCLKMYDLLDVLNEKDKCYIFVIWIGELFFVFVDE